ncbi:hypothetical protein BXU06_13875 [Aquaspirillum sp. LM1]|uniref:hypothetical protein n=1 Tax=Aquaspirillum sp. LM1 TaxID=1938604 RepID=UPI00098404D6|nr:hypothetical protein [Aquaspirillum sp. LM1]AQR66021.1 hypothetical protein BXU06_13875 [Aquaspirillum sp. LM1]
MLPLTKIDAATWPDSALQHLQAIQAEIDACADFDLRAKKADSKWNSKTRSQAGEQAFAKVREQLKQESVGAGLCCYCEQNEATDIEHVLPKSLFPGQAFAAHNYLLACKTCNTGHKLDKMAVFVPSGSAVSQSLGRQEEPASQDMAFIHPRKENPLALMLLDWKTGLFAAHPKTAPAGSREKQKVLNTIEILGLNTRDALVNCRQNAVKDYQRLLREYVNIKQATNHKELDEASGGHPEIDPSVPLATEQQRLLSCIRAQIARQPHPAVWVEIWRSPATPKKMREWMGDAQELSPLPGLSITFK